MQLLQLTTADHGATSALGQLQELSRMQGSVLHSHNIHDGAQLDCAVSYAAQHLWSLWVLDLDAYIVFLPVVLLLGGRMPLQPQ